MAPVNAVKFIPKEKKNGNGFNHPSPADKLLIKNLQIRLQNAENSNAKLKRDMADLNGMIEDTNRGIWQHDLLTGETKRSPQYSIMLGFTPQEIGADTKSWESLVHPDDLGLANKALREYLEGSTPYYDVIYRMKGREGELHWIHDVGVGNRDENGNVWRISGTHTDITRHKETEGQLEHTQAILRQFIDVSTDLIAIKDDKGRYIISNTANTRYFGLGREEQILGKTDFDLMPALAVECARTDSLALEQNDVVVAVERVRGSVFETRKFPIDFPDGTRGVGIIVRNITEAKNGEEEREMLLSSLEEMNLQLIKAAEWNDSQYHRLAHDFRGPLGSVIKLAGYLKADIESEGLATGGTGRAGASDTSNIGPRLLEIEKALKHIYAALNNHLEYVKSSNGLKLNLDMADISFPCAAILDLYNARSREKEIQLISTVPSGTWAYMDANQAQSVIGNLVDNAIKFTPRGGRVEIGCTADDGALIVFVKDTGRGMPQDESAHLFGQEKVMHTSEGTEHEPGTGVGLATVEKKVTKMGGRIWADSVLGAGATFYFTLPLQPPEA